MQAAEDAHKEGLKGKYPMAAIVIAQELQHQVAKNFCLTPEVERAQTALRESRQIAKKYEDRYFSACAAIKEAIENIKEHGGDDAWPILQRLKAELKAPNVRISGADK